MLFRIFSKKQKKIYKQTKIFETTYKDFSKTGVTSQEGHSALINLYCLTNGKFSEEKNNILLKKSPNKNLDFNTHSIFNNNSSNLDRVNKELNKDGYAMLDGKISEDIVQKIVTYALNTKTTFAPKYDTPVFFDKNNVQSEIYRFNATDIVNCKEIQDLIMDPYLINVARNYLNSEPIFDFPAMWWSTNYLKTASEEAAQLYHFDMDRLKWLKIFIYLTDVTPSTGPHCYIKGSHIAGSKPTALLNRGYARIPDADLTTYYKNSDFVTLCANAGTVFAGDTKCWHKGTPLQNDCRLVLEFEYTTSMFGANYGKFEIKNPTEKFKEFCTKNSYYASNFVLS